MFVLEAQESCKFGMIWSRYASLQAQVLRAKEEKQKLAEQVELLESTVSKHIRAKVELQEKLMKSRETEQSLREELENRRSQLAMKTFSLHEDDEPADDTDGRGTDDLEFSYDGLDLCNLMPFDRAFRLASRSGRSEKISEVDEKQMQEALEDLEKFVQEITEQKAETAEKSEKNETAEIAETVEKVDSLSKEVEKSEASDVKQTDLPEDTTEAELVEPAGLVPETVSERTEESTPKRQMPVVSGFAFMSPYASLYKYI